MNEPWKQENIGEFFKRHLAEFREQETTPYEDEQKEREYQAFHSAYPIEKFNRWSIGDVKYGEEKEIAENPGYFAEFRSKFPLCLR
jgi:hypothetical protein